jgi:iron complex transport system substrate-binding protein
MRMRATLAALAALTVLAGCGSTGEDDGGTGAGGSASGAAFPVTIEHAFGSTRIEEQPERVVVLGWSAQDVVYALGVTPVGMPTYPYGGGDDGVLPWDDEFYDAAGTTLLDTTDGPPLEDIAALRPDVILATYEGFDQATYDDLNGIAPTVAYPGEAWTTPWEEQTRMIGEALGKIDEAERLIDGTNATVQKVADEHPEWAGLTFAYTSMGADRLSLYLGADPRVQLIEKLGLTLDPSVETLAGSGDTGTFYSEISLERAPEIAADVVIGFADGLTADQVAALPVYAQVPAVQRGSAVIVDDQEVAAAMSAVSVLAIPYALDQLTGRLATAAGNAAA